MYSKYSQRLESVEALLTLAVGFGLLFFDVKASWEAFEDDQEVLPPTRFCAHQSLMSVTQTAVPQRRVQANRPGKKKSAKINPITGQDEFPADTDSAFEGDCSSNFAVGRFPPYKRNMEELLLFLPSGETFKNLHIVRLDRDTLFLSGEDTKWFVKNSMARGSLCTREIYDLGDTILQIQLSTALDVLRSNDTIMIIGIRTTHMAMLFKIIPKYSGRKYPRLVFERLHTATQASLSAHQETISRPAHMLLSPYTGQQYALLDSKGNATIYDITSFDPDGIFCRLGKTMMRDGKLCTEEWTSCIFGPHSRSLIVASSKNVAIYDFKTTDVKPATSTYACLPNEKIYCIGALNTINSFHYCVATTSRILLMDTRYPHKPVVCWEHHLADDPPNVMQLSKDQSDPDLVTILVWSASGNTSIQLRYKYNGRLEFTSPTQPPEITPAIFSQPTYASFTPHTAILHGEPSPIPVIGVHAQHELMQCESSGDTKSMSIMFRMLRNGALHRQIILLDKPPAIQSSQTTPYIVRPPKLVHFDYISITREITLRQEHDDRHFLLVVWEPRIFFQKLIRDAVLSRLLPLTTQHLVDSDVETTSPVPINMWSMVSSGNRDQLLRMDNLDNLHRTIQSHGFNLLRSQNRLFITGEHWNPIPGQQNTEVLALEEVSNSVCNTQVEMTPMQRQNRTQLERLFAKDMECHLSCYLPPPIKGEEQFQYLRPSKYTTAGFKPTSSTVLMGQEWRPGQDSFVPPDLSKPLQDRNTPLFHRFQSDVLSASQPDALSSSQPDVFSASQPLSLASQSPSFESIATQPVPGAFASRPDAAKKKKSLKKKRKITSGFM